VTSKRHQAAPSPLREAADAFADELATYTSLSEAFQRVPLESTKHLERANDTLSQIAASEQRLAVCGQRLAEAVGAARDKQESLAKATLDKVPQIKQRMDELRALLAQFEALAGDAGAINSDAAQMSREAADKQAQITRARELAERMLALSQRAHEITGAARAASFEELANRAHALHQQLLSAHHKLKLAVVG
jgi:DNA repair exonuclease SbcCD ATPase subunit